MVQPAARPTRRRGGGPRAACSRDRRAPRRLRRYGGSDGGARPGDRRRYGGGASRRRAGMPGVADAAFRAGLALADRAGGFALVSDDVAVPADRSRRLGRGRRAADRKSTRLNSVTHAQLVCRLLLEKKKT